MKLLQFILPLLCIASLGAQSQNEIGNELFSHLKEDALILTNGVVLKDDRKIEKFVSNFSVSNGKISSYKRKFGIEVTPQLDYEIGEIQTATGLFSVMFLKRKESQSGAKIEFLTIYKNENPDNRSSDIDLRREEWMELCNSHKATELVKKVYTSDAYYYNRGRLLQGTKSITAEYGYMNSPGYTLKLTPKHLEFVTSEIAFEIGRCSGSYPLPYMLLWQKQSDGKWQVLMDSNY